MSGYEIFSLIGTAIDIIKILGEFYSTIKTYEGLPKAFKEVHEQLPLVEDTLTRAKGRISGLDAPTRVAAKGILQQCEENLRGLVNIFEALKDAEGKSLKNVYTRAVITIGKRGRVEDLMKDTLSSVKQLAENQVFQLSDQVEQLQKAIEELTKVAPSIPDAELEKALATSGFTMIGDHGVQFGNSGDAFHAPNGQFYQAGAGTFNYNNYGPERQTRWDAVIRWLQPRTQSFHDQQSEMDTNDLLRRKHEGAILEETGQWLLKNPSFLDWRSPASSTSVFWLYGDAGHGKSVLCVRTILFFEDVFKRNFDRFAHAAFHFFDHTDESRMPAAVYRNLAESLFRQKWKIGGEVSDRIHAFAGCSQTEPDLKAFITTIVEELKVAYIFLDGLDEVFHDGPRNQLPVSIEILKFCIGLTANKNTRVKIWCSSQERSEICRVMDDCPNVCRLHLTEKENAADIAAFITKTAEEMLGDNFDLKKLSGLLEIIKTIRGNFLWAALAMDALKDAGTSWQLDELLRDLPSDFEVYLKKQIGYIRPSSYRIFSQVMSCLVYVKRPLSCDELREAIEASMLSRDGSRNIDSQHQLYPSRIKEQCAPFLRMERLSSGQMVCSVYHTSVRRFLEHNPGILQSDEHRKYGTASLDDISISPRILAYATLRYLQQPRYRRLLRPHGKGASATFFTDEPSDGPQDIMRHHLLTYSAKNWARHVDDFQRFQMTQAVGNDAICEEVDQFIRSDNFGTCLQVQSLFIEAKFSIWYRDKENRYFYSGDCGGFDDGTKEKHLTRSLPCCYTDQAGGGSLHQQYQEAVLEWGYFLGSCSTIRGQLRGQIDKCQWPSLGRSNFMRRMQSRLKSYRLEKEEEGGVVSTVPVCPSSNGSSSSSTPSHFLGCGRHGHSLYSVSLHGAQVPYRHSTILDNTPRADTHWRSRRSGPSEGKPQVQVQQWIMKKTGHRHKPQEAVEQLETVKHQLQLYTLPLQNHQIQVGRASRVAITGDGDLLRIGAELYARDGAGELKALDFGDAGIQYVEEMCRRGPWVAVVHRRGVKLAEIGGQQQHPDASGTGNGEVREVMTRPRNPRYDSSSSSSSSSSSDSSDSGDQDSSDDSDSLRQNANESQAPAMADGPPDADDMDLDSDSSNSAYESHSDGSTTEASDEIRDDDLWNDWGSEEEDMGFKPLDAPSDEDSSGAALSITAGVASDEGDEPDVEMTITGIRVRGEDPVSDASSDVSLKSTIPPDMWGDSDSVSERSDEGHEPAFVGAETTTTTEERVPDRHELVVFHLDDPSAGRARRCFRFAYRWTGRLFTSPPVIHPTQALAVWPLGRNEILFANFDGSPEKTYFIRSLGCGARDVCHISVQANFSHCGSFLHVACLDGRLGSSSSSNEPGDPQTETKATAALRKLYLRVSTYRLSQRKPTRSPPRLVYRAAVPLDSHALRESGGGGGNGRLPASPLPFAMTWTADHVYATESHRVLRVYRVPLYRGVEARELAAEDVPGSAGPDSDTDDETRPARLAAFVNAEQGIFLPDSAGRRAVHFFPTPEEGPARKTKGKKAKPTSTSHSKREKTEGEKVIATVVISPEDDLVGGVQPYVGPPQVVQVTADEFGPWKRAREDDCGGGTGKECAEGWKGGQLEARYERFDRQEDCDVVPYFR